MKPRDQRKYPALYVFWEKVKGIIRTVGWSNSETRDPHIDIHFSSVSSLIITCTGKFFMEGYSEQGRRQVKPVSVGSAVRKYGSEAALIAAMRGWLKDRIDQRLKAIHEEESLLRDYWYKLV